MSPADDQTRLIMVIVMLVAGGASLVAAWWLAKRPNASERAVADMLKFSGWGWFAGAMVLRWAPLPWDEAFVAGAITMIAISSIGTVRLLKYAKDIQKGGQKGEKS